MEQWITSALWFGLGGLALAVLIYAYVRSQPSGNETMQELAELIRSGAMTFLWREYSILIPFVLFVAGLLYWLITPRTAYAYLFGAFCSLLAGLIGMRAATLANVRTTEAARAEGQGKALRIAFSGGAVMGLAVASLGLAGLGSMVLIYRPELVGTTVFGQIISGFAMGASTIALFARIGGGIFTKAADVGADLVGKIEAGIPEDDPRNPASIADNVGDNVGDVAGMGADLYESYAGSILATSALGVAAASALGNVTWGADAMNMIAVPMVIAAVGILASIWFGINVVETKEGATMAELMGALNKGLVYSSCVIVVAAYGICALLLGGLDGGVLGVGWFGVASAVVVGLGSGWLIGKSTEYYTSYDFAPTQRIAKQAETGPATVIIAGIAEGLKSTWASLAIIIVAIMLSFTFAGGGREFVLGLYGVGLAAVGMLATLGFTLATDAYGPIADNAGGNAEMSQQAPEVRERTDALDSLGNTTAATGKGFAIGSAALTALALMAAYVEEVRIGLVREAVSYVTSIDDEAAQNDDASVGEAYYIGYRKFALKFRAGTNEASYDAFLLLSDPKVWNAQLKAATNKADIKLTNLIPAVPTKDEHFVQTTHITDADGKEHEVRVVRVRRASLQQFMEYYNVTLMNPKVLCGIFSGVLLAFLFCALTMQAVGRAAYQMMLECRDQFKKMAAYLVDVKGMSEEDAANSDNWPREQVQYKGGVIPDYARCVDISTLGAQREMIFPSLLAIAMPVAVGLIFGVPGVMGMLVGGLTSGFAVAIFMANAGGAWDNAKKYIEKGNYGGKGSDAHKASIVGDTVGDPFKDTSGPSLNILIKLMSMVSVVFAGLVVKYAPQISSWLGLG